MKLLIMKQLYNVTYICFVTKHLLVQPHLYHSAVASSLRRSRLQGGI